MNRFIKRIIISLFVFYTFYTLIIKPIYALDNSTSDNEINLGAPGNFSKLGEITSGNMISVAVNIIYIISTLTFFFILLFGGVRWITSSGDEKKLAAASASITHGLIGLAIVFVAWAFMSLLSKLFGFDFTNLTIKSLN